MPPQSINSNATALAYAEETSLKVLPGTPVWYPLEPNSYTDLGASYSTVARTPITATRQQSKGTQTDLDAKAGFNSDITQRNLTRLLQGFFFADALEKPATQPFNGTQIPITSVTVGPNKFNAASGLGIFKAGHLIFAKDFGNSANNGLKIVTIVAANFVQTSSTLAAEAAPPTDARLQVCGFQFPAGDLTLTVGTGAQVILGATATDLTTLGLNVGEWMFIGGDASVNQFATAANKGYARIASIAATQVVLDITTFVPVNDTGVGQQVRIFFGKVLVNAANPTNIKRRTYTLERHLGNDGAGEQAEYVLGSVPNEFTVNLQQNSKATADLSFVGMTTQYNDGAVGLMAGTRKSLLNESAFNTSHDIYAMRLSIVDPNTLNPTPLFGYASDIKFQVKNNVTPNKALAVLGAFEANAGYFEVTGTVTAYFASVDAAAAVRNNSDVCLSTILAHSNSGIIFDLPLLMLGGGLNKVEKDKPVMVDLTQTGAVNPNGYTFLANFFEYLPTVAMPA